MRATNYTRIGGILLGLLLILGVASADGVTVDDLVNLMNAGFSEAEVKQEIERRGGAPRLTAADAKKLRQAGFSKRFIDSLRGTGGGGLSLDDIKAASKAGQSAADIIDRIIASGARFAITPGQALDLSRAGVKPAVLRVLRGRPLTKAQLLGLVRGGTPENALLAALRAVGSSFRPKPDEALELMRAGVPAAVVKRLKEGARAAAAGGWQRYEHVSRRFQVDYPPKWRHLRYVNPAELVVEHVFTPQLGEVDPESVQTAFTVSVLSMEASNPFAEIELEDVARRMRPLILGEEPGLKQREGTDVQLTRIGGVEAALMEFTGTMKKKGATELRALVGIIRRPRHLFLIAAVAPLKEYASVSDTFGKMADRLRIGRPTFVKPPPLTAQQFVEKYKGSVPMVVAPLGGGMSSQGTGFVVRSDGYVITNHHVVFNRKTNKPVEEVILKWDPSLKRDPVKAKVIEARQTYSSGAARDSKYGAWGDDIALLKIVDPGPWVAIPMAPVETVKLSDPVITMGFPLTSAHGENISIFVSRGVVVRFNRDNLDNIDGFYIDAKVTSGNSGGPCIDLETGSVVGINTYVYSQGGGSDAESKRLAQLMQGYYGVISIDKTLNLWPDVLEHDALSERGRSAQDYLGLALDYLGSGLLPAADRMADEALKLEPRFTEALVVRAASAMQAGDSTAFQDYAARALKVDPNHYQALIMLANYHGSRNEFAKSAEYADRAIAAQPDDPAPYVTRGRLLLAVRRYDDALKDADKATELSRDVSPDPHVLAGEIYYEMKKLDEGRARYKKALAVSPASFDAMAGEGRYYELKNMYEAATMEYGKLRSRFPKAPVPEMALGRCYMQLKQYDKAFDSLIASSKKFKKLQVRPPEDLFEDLARLTMDIKFIQRVAQTVLVDYVNTHPQSANANLRMAAFQQKTGRQSLAYGHALLAVRGTGADTAVKQKAAGFRRDPLKFKDLGTMNDMGYGIVGLRIAAVAPFAFTINAAELEKVKGRLPPLLAAMYSIILDRQKRGEAERSGGPGPGPAPGTGTVYSHPDGTMDVGIPKGFTRTPNFTNGAHKDGFTFLTRTMSNTTLKSDLFIFAFPANVTGANTAFQQWVKLWDKRTSMEFRFEKDTETKFGQIAARRVTGTLKNKKGTVWLWEAIFAMTPKGVRGVIYTIGKDSYAKGAQERAYIFKNLKIGPGGKTTPPPRRDPPPTPPANTETKWSAPDGSLSIGFPAGFKGNASFAKKVRDAGWGWLGHTSAGPHGMDFHILTFDAGVTNVDRAYQLVSDWQMKGMNGYQMRMTNRRNVKFGTTPAIRGTGTTANKASTYNFEIVLVPTPKGVRGVFIVGNTSGWPKGKTIRDQVLGALRIATGGGGGGARRSAPPPGGAPPGGAPPGGAPPGGAPPGGAPPGGAPPGGAPPGGAPPGGTPPGGTPPGGGARPPSTPPGGGGVTTFSNRIGTLRFAYARSFGALAEAKRRYNANGFPWVELVAVDQKRSADIVAGVFGARVRTVGQALVEFQRFERSIGVEMRKTAQMTHRFKNGQSGMLYRGTSTFRNGATMSWEGLFVTTRAGSYAVVYHAPAAAFNAAARERQRLFQSISVR